MGSTSLLYVAKSLLPEGQPEVGKDAAAPCSNDNALITSTGLCRHHWAYMRPLLGGKMPHVGL